MIKLFVDINFHENVQKAAVEGGQRYAQSKSWTGAARVGLDKTSMTFGLKANISTMESMMVRCE